MGAGVMCYWPIEFNLGLLPPLRTRGPQRHVIIILWEGKFAAFLFFILSGLKKKGIPWSRHHVMR